MPDDAASAGVASVTGRRRVSLALGTWQLIVLLGALEQVDGAAGSGPPDEDHLVLYGLGLPDAMREAMWALASTGRQWTSIVWANDLLVKPAKPGSGDNGTVAKLQELLGFDRADELWMCKLFDFPEKVAAVAFPTAQIQLYEDGMHFYVPQPTIAGPTHDWTQRTRSIARRSAKWIIGRGDPFWMPGLWTAHEQRVVACWAVLPASSGLALPPALRRQIDLGLVRAQLDRMTALAGNPVLVDDALDGRPIAIVLGQAFSLFDLMTREHEYDVYAEACRILLEEGFRVLWKDHPRLEVGFGPQLFDELAALGPISPLQIPSQWPVEAAVATLRPSAVVSATSTSLFLSSALFGTACYSFADELHIKLLRRDHHWMARLAAEAFPSPREARHTFESSVHLGAAP